jgi:hypothetical protein
MIQDEEQRA